jgi:lipopolysaccharide export system permease protein
MKTLDWYILKKFLGTFFYAIIIMAAISCVIDYSEKVDDFVKHQAPAILGYFKNFIPHIVALLYPLFIFIATIFFTSKMAYRSEIIAILAAGVSFPRVLRPYVIGSVLLGIIFLLFNHWIVPNASRQRLRFEDKYVHESVNYSDRNVHLRLNKNQYVYVQHYDYAVNMGYQFTAEMVDGTELLEKIMADRASYDSVKKIWTLYNVTIRTNDGLKESLRKEHMVTREFPFTPKDLLSDEDKMFAMTTPQLNAFIELQETRGVENLNVYHVEKHRRTAQPFSGFILTVIGACIASRRIRGGSGLHLALGIAISAVYIMLMQFSNTFSIKAGLNPFIAVWIPNIIFGGVAWYLYRRQVR